MVQIIALILSIIIVSAAQADERFIKAINSSVAYLDHTSFAEYLTAEQLQLKELYETMKK